MRLAWRSFQTASRSLSVGLGLLVDFYFPPSEPHTSIVLFLMREIDRDVLPLRVALEHAFKRKLAADTAFFVAAI